MAHLTLDEADSIRAKLYRAQGFARTDNYDLAIESLVAAVEALTVEATRPMRAVQLAFSCEQCKRPCSELDELSWTCLRCTVARCRADLSDVVRLDILLLEHGAPISSRAAQLTWLRTKFEQLRSYERAVRDLAAAPAATAERTALKHCEPDANEGGPTAQAAHSCSDTDVSDSSVTQGTEP